jgi:hypothetical protein
VNNPTVATMRGRKRGARIMHCVKAQSAPLHVIAEKKM